MQLRETQVADGSQQIMRGIRIAWCSLGAEPLQRKLQILKRDRIDEIAKLFGAKKLPKKITVERECGGASFRKRRVAFVHVCGDPVEQQ
ncbi:MAG: hypothetical protein NVSMB57_08950 [Actinomycetota bacterium]